MAAREIDSGSKVILPVWHDVNHHFIVQRSPVLADRLGALTSNGIDAVAGGISRALEEAPGDPVTSSPTEAVDARRGSGNDEGPLLFQIPTTNEEQAKLVSQKSEWWEHRLYAGVLMQGRIELEDKWHDHRLRLPSGSWRETSESVPDLLSREAGSMRRQMAIIGRLFDAVLLEQAFGAPGVAGDSTLIIHIARGITQSYETMMDWGAELRRTSVASGYEEILELTARMVDGPVGQIRDFIQMVADQIARIPILLKEAKANGATPEAPMALDLDLHVELDPVNQEGIQAALGRLG